MSALYDAIVMGDVKKAVTETEKLLRDGASPVEMVQQQMIPAMDEVGHRYECEEYFVPELMLAGRAMRGALELIRPLLVARGEETVGKVVIGTVKGDHHDIGKNLVAFMLEGAGFEVLDLGSDVDPGAFVNAVKQKKPDLVCLSALLTITMPAMKTTIQALVDAGVRDQVKVLVGGAPVTNEFSRLAGADAYGETATAAVNLARKYVAAG